MQRTKLSAANINTFFLNPTILAINFALIVGCRVCQQQCTMISARHRPQFLLAGGCVLYGGR
jgi:hypothetical protein